MPSNAATNPPPSSGASSPSRNRASTPSSSTSGSREHRLCKQLIRIDERTSSELEWRFYDTAKWMQNEYDSTLGPALNWRIAREPREREATQ